MPSYQYRKSHCGDKTILRPSYLHNGISYTGKMASLYWFSPRLASYNKTNKEHSERRPPPRLIWGMWNSLARYETVSTLRPRQNGRHFEDGIFKCIFLNDNGWILLKISLKFVPRVPINNIPALVHIMAWRRSGDKPLSESMMVSLLTHICVTRLQWVNPKLFQNMPCSMPHLSWQFHEDLLVCHVVNRPTNQQRWKHNYHCKEQVKITGGWINIKMPSYQYGKSHCGDKTVVRSSYLHKGIFYTGKMASLYWIRALISARNVTSLLTYLLHWLICAQMSTYSFLVES